MKRLIRQIKKQFKSDEFSEQAVGQTPQKFEIVRPDLTDLHLTYMRETLISMLQNSQSLIQSHK